MKRIGDFMMAAGFIMFMIFGSAIDGPGNNMILVYGGCIASMAAMLIGYKIMGRRKEMGKYTVKNFSTLTDSAALVRVACLINGDVVAAQAGNVKILVRKSQESTTYTLLDKKAQ